MLGVVLANTSSVLSAQPVPSTLRFQGRLSLQATGGKVQGNVKMKTFYGPNPAATVASKSGDGDSVSIPIIRYKN